MKHDFKNKHMGNIIAEGFFGFFKCFHLRDIYKWFHLKVDSNQSRSFPKQQKNRGNSEIFWFSFTTYGKAQTAPVLKSRVVNASGQMTDGSVIFLRKSMMIHGMNILLKIIRPDNPTSHDMHLGL